MALVLQAEVGPCQLPVSLSVVLGAYAHLLSLFSFLTILCHKGLKTLNAIQSSEICMPSDEYQNSLGADVEIK